jgi:hypothetical protein
MKNYHEKLKGRMVKTLSALVIIAGVYIGEVWGQAAPADEIVIVVPFERADKEVRIWAQQESEIDFRRQSDRAARCTAAFAATELADFLKRTLNKAEISFAANRPEGKFFIELALLNPTSRKDSFRLAPVTGGVLITGDGRAGLLYGAYELLRLQGWRWYAPGISGEIAPAKRDRLVLPECAKKYNPSMTRGRGFFMEDVGEESTAFWIWMARNRLNVVGYRPATGALANKLGMIFNVGGHIFEKILDPDRTLPSGKTLWQEHEQWYGLPATGQRDKKTALRTQFCACQPDLMEFLGGELLKKLMGEWRQADLVEVWGFDTWGNTCTCPRCRDLGNSTDQMLHFVSALRDYLNWASRDGKLDHPVTLSACAYEGTSTMSGPAKAFPQNLIEAGDVIVFYPINRCYAHNLYDPACTDNQRYQQALQSWLAQSPKMDVYFGEYYNVSKYEDLPVLFTSGMRKDIPGHFAAGCRGITYMHVPFVNWAVRALTQNLYAQLAWDADTNVEAYLTEYFNLWYGPYADRMRPVYDDVENAWRYISQWRSWENTSVLSQFLGWNGSKPKTSMSVPQHFGNPAQAIAEGRQAVEKLNHALGILESFRQDKDFKLPYEMRLGEDRRSVRYGLHTMEIMTTLIAYHEALFNDQAEEANAQWKQIQQAADLLDSYWVPINYAETGTAGIVSRDALTRTQVRDLVRNCRDYRAKNNLPLNP